MNFEFEQELTFENEAVLIRPLLPEDKANLLGIASEDRQLLQYSPKQIYTQELLDRYIEGAIHERKVGLRYPLVILDKRTEAYAGCTGFLNVSNLHKRLEIGGTWLGRRFHGSGLNRCCKILLLSFAFDELGAERVEFRTDERNIVSRRAIQAIGAQLEGILREDTLMSDGFRRNTACYSMLRREWDVQKTLLRCISKTKT
jgi:RimJ/RimL family protein N-acetyltransferase